MSVGYDVLAASNVLYVNEFILLVRPHEIILLEVQFTRLAKSNDLAKAKLEKGCFLEAYSSFIIVL